jgi:hypothetical protein
MKKWLVEFDRVETYEVEVEATTALEAEKLATARVRDYPDAYLINDEGIECVGAEEI